MQSSLSYHLKMRYLESPLHAIAIFVFFLTLCFIGVIVKKKLTPHQLPLPPGPKGIPFIGSALETNRSEPWLTFGKWKETYGRSLCGHDVLHYGNGNDR